MNFKEEALKYHIKDVSHIRKGLDEYSYWFQAAYPQRRDRQIFLRSLIEGQPITCYRRSDIECLPRWLQERGLSPGDDVCFVVRNKDEKARGKGVRDDADLRQEYYATETMIQSTLEAEDVFAAMIRAFGLSQPLLTSDPLGFLADQLRGLMPNVDTGSADIYFIVD